MKGIILEQNEVGVQDLMVKNGSLVVGDIDLQITEHILRAYPGEYKEVPTLGAHAESMICGNLDPFWKNKTMDMLKSQGINIKKLEINTEGIQVEI